MDGFEYLCVVNGVNLTAQYENESSILCIVGSGQVSVDNEIHLIIHMQLRLINAILMILCTAHTFRWGQQFPCDCHVNLDG